MPTEPYDPQPYDADGERASRFGAVTDLYWFQRAEPNAEDSFGQSQGQGQYIPYGRLTQAWKDRHEEHEALYQNGFDYGAHW